MSTLAVWFFENGGWSDPGLERYLQDRPEAQEYAAFRAAVEERGVPLTARDKVETTERDRSSSGNFAYHLYCQWNADSQIKKLAEGFGALGMSLYLDLPLGVHPDGYDARKFQAAFAEDVSGGAPPDAFFTLGQNWGFRPIHPEYSRQTGHEYFRRVIKQLMRYCNVLRVDHVMSLHRLYWVPNGFDADQGVYVRYPEEELFAVLAIESQLEGCTVVGEDLGTVPPIVREVMDQRGVMRMYVGQFENSAESTPPVNQVAPNMVASLNTHDTPTFYGFWQGRDQVVRRELGLLDKQGLATELEARGRTRRALVRHFGLQKGLEEVELAEAILESWLAFLAASEADCMIINLEDLWLEGSPQNVPGTSTGRPNWRRKCRLAFEEFDSDERIKRVLHRVNELRGG
jgi:4-alpha-glucanotransferase